MMQRTVKSLEDDVLLAFVSYSQDVEPIKQYIGPRADQFDAFFVLVEDGEYKQVWGIEGTFPAHEKIATKLI